MPVQAGLPSELLAASKGGALIAKDGGGESCFGIGLVDQGIGIAVKIEDGGNRALAPVVTQVLTELELLPQAALAELARYRERPIRTYGGVLAGSIKAVSLT